MINSDTKANFSNFFVKWQSEQSELKSGDKSAILFANFAITPHIIAVDGTN